MAVSPHIQSLSSQVHAHPDSYPIRKSASPEMLESHRIVPPVPQPMSMTRNGTAGSVDSVSAAPASGISIPANWNICLVSANPPGRQRLLSFVSIFAPLLSALLLSASFHRRQVVCTERNLLPIFIHMQAALAQALDIEISGILKHHGCDREAVAFARFKKSSIFVMSTDSSPQQQDSGSG